MGGASGCLEPGFQTLPEYDVEFGSSDLPAWVSAGGKALFEQAVGLANTRRTARCSDIKRWSF